MKHEFWQQRLDYVIPGGAHTYSKGRDVFPINAPAILSRGKGASVWTPEGRRYLDFGMGLKSVVLGYADRDIDRSARRATRSGNNLSRPSLSELLAAEELLTILSGFDMVKFAKNGSNVTTAAVKIARAATGRKLVAVPMEQPFFSFDDWFIGITPVKSGIPEEHFSLTKTFRYGDMKSIRDLFADCGKEIAALLMEPAVDLLPCEHTLCSLQDCLPLRLERTKEFLREVRSLCDKFETVLIFDEMRTGFRWNIGGIQEMLDVRPDLTTFGKAIANGYSVSALVGKRALMSHGSTERKGTQRTFLLSSTHGAEIVSLEALRATSKKMQQEEVTDYLWSFGVRMGELIRRLLTDSEWGRYIVLSGPPVALDFNFVDGPNWTSTQLKTRFLSLMIDAGVLMPTISQSWSHGDKEMKLFSRALNRTLDVLTSNVHSCTFFQEQEHLLAPVFRKFN
jgi:glutamate-1-semialdehyde 2,1-aminomutase